MGFRHGNMFSLVGYTICSINLTPLNLLNIDGAKERLVRSIYTVLFLGESNHYEIYPNDSFMDLAGSYGLKTPGAVR